VSSHSLCGTLSVQRRRGRLARRLVAVSSARSWRPKLALDCSGWGEVWRPQADPELLPVRQCVPPAPPCGWPAEKRAGETRCPTPERQHAPLSSPARLWRGQLPPRS
jgi:hypothetical protein